MPNPLQSSDDVTQSAIDRHEQSKPDIEQPRPDRGAKVRFGGATRDLDGAKSI